MSAAKAMRIARGLARLAKAEALRALAAVDEWAGVPEDERVGAAKVAEPEKVGDCAHHQDAPAECTHEAPVASCAWCIVRRLTEENERLRKAAKPQKRATRAKSADAKPTTEQSSGSNSLSNSKGSERSEG